MGMTVTHYLVLLRDRTYICDCCMGLNLGVSCRHYFQVLLKMPSLRFHIGLIRPRWYQNRNLSKPQSRHIHSPGRVTGSQ